MTDTKWELPFGPESPDEILLHENPLVTVIAQVTFPTIATIANQDSVATFQAKIRGDYPVLRQERQAGLVLSASGEATAQTSEPIWRFSDVKNEWTASLSPGFIALQTTAYTQRSEFFERLVKLLEVAQEEIKPGLFDRLGVRYVNRFVGEQLLGNLPAYIRREALGMAELSYVHRAALGQYIALAQFKVADAVMIVRTAYLPPSVTIDPSVPPIPEKSWLLDLDMATDLVSPGEFDAKTLAVLGEEYSRHIYRFFRWAVTPELIRLKGGAS